MKELLICRRFLLFNFVLGCILLGVGMVMLVIPHSSLDALLDREELRDPAIRETTLAKLHRRWGSSAAVPLLAGFVTIAGSVIGLMGIAKIVRPRRVPGLHPGAITMSDDFDQPLSLLPDSQQRSE